MTVVLVLAVVAFVAGMVKGDRDWVKKNSQQRRK